MFFLGVFRFSPPADGPRSACGRGAPAARALESRRASRYADRDKYRPPAEPDMVAVPRPGGCPLRATGGGVRRDGGRRRAAPRPGVSRG